MEEDKLWFGRYLRKRRLALGMTQPQFAELLGEKQGTISKWEGGQFPKGKVPAIYRLLGGSLIENCKEENGEPTREQLLEKVQRLERELDSAMSEMEAMLAKHNKKRAASQI